MSYYLNINTKKLHNESCYIPKQYVKGNEQNWIKFGNLKAAQKHCKNDGREYEYCKICFPDRNGKTVN